ncbi:MAG: phosphatidate cytidylyltransferase [Myxococcota bacterium]
MLTRIITGLTLAPLIIWLVLAGPPWAVALFLVAAGVLSLAELLAMALPERRVERAVGVALGGALLALFAWGSPRAWSVAGVVALAAPGLAALAFPRPLERAGVRMLALMGSLFYVVGTFAFVLKLGEVPGHLMLSFAVVWLGDTGAYFAGRALGRHKLYELISPKKTIEGSVGGLLASVGGAFLIRAWLLPDLDVGTCLVLGAGGGAIAQVGDLVESVLKRTFGVKDSGRLLPGHGGVLDRLDGFLFSAPFLATVLGWS